MGADRETARLDLIRSSGHKNDLICRANLDQGSRQAITDGWILHLEVFPVAALGRSNSGLGIACSSPRQLFIHVAMTETR